MQLYISKNKMQQSKENGGEGERWTGSRKREIENDGKHVSENKLQTSMDNQNISD